MAAQQPPRQGASARPTGAAGPQRNSSRWATLAPLLIIVVGLVEIALLIIIGMNTSFWWAVLAVVLGWLIGLALLVTAGQQSFTRLRSLVRAVRGRGDVQDHLSRPVFTLLAALFFFFPGVLTDLLGLVLLLTPVQRRSLSALGLSDSGGARTVLSRRSAGGVIDGEIILENRSQDRGTDGPPPTLIQD